MKRVLFTVYTFIIFYSVVKAEEAIQSQYKFNYLTVDQGLSNNLIKNICQDFYGFIWFVTPNSIDRYDGESIVSFRHDPKDSTTLSSDLINTVFSDSKGNLWIATEAGLELYDRNYNSFKIFTHKDLSWPIGRVEVMAEDKKNKLWIGAATGLYSYDLITNNIEHFSSKPNNKHGLPSALINRLLVDRDNNVWAAFMGEGLCVFNQESRVFKFYNHNPEDNSSISQNRIESLYEDKEGNIWAGTMDNGVNCYKPGQGSFIRIIPDENNSYSNRVRAIFEDMKGNFFLGTRGGLYLMDKSTYECSHYAYEGHDFSNLSQNSVTCSYIDKSGTLWIGTFSGGANFTDLNRKEFVYYQPGKNLFFLNGSNIYAIEEDLQDNLWIGGDNGLNFLNRKTNLFTYYIHDPENPQTLSYNDIKALESDQTGNLWIGTNNGGLNYFNINTRKFKCYINNPDDPNSIASNKIYGLFNDYNNNLWIIVNVEGKGTRIDIMPNGTDKFIHYEQTVNLGFDQDAKGNVYVGGENGFWKFNRIDSTFSFISNDSLIGNVNAIKYDSENRIWIGSEKGLVRYDPRDRSFVLFSNSNGYPIFKVFGILEDKDKNLWISTDKGLIRLERIVQEIQNIKLKVYNSKDGLQSRQFNYNAYLKCRSGEMAFGGIRGFNTFFPDQIKDNTVPPSIVITDLKVFNSSVEIGKEVNGRVILRKSILETDKIKLGRKQNLFTIVFSALHNADHSNNSFKYMLEGFDTEWQYQKSKSNNATYSNLPAGNYTFILTAANSDGIWNEVPVKLKIIILPPFWKTWWFYSLIIILVFIGSRKLIKMREQQLKADKDRLEDELDKGKAEIENQKNEILKQQEAIRLKEEQEASLKWHNEGIAKFSDLISSNQENVEKLSQSILSNLLPYVGADQGGLFLVNEKNHEEENKVLELVASYAYSKEKFEKTSFMPGEGLIGTCFLECRINKIDNLPPAYTHFSSGLGEAPLKHLVLLPVKLGEYLIGVLELASFHKIEDHKVEFIEKVTENLTSVISIVRGSEQALQAVQIANEQKEEMLAQEEEIRQNMEEMQATQDELLRKQYEFANENAMFETLLNFLQERITFKDPDGIYLRINKLKANALKLKDSKDAIGLSDADFFGEEHYKKALAEERKLLKSGEAILNNEEQLKFNDGRVQWGSTSRVPFRNSRGEMVGTLIITKNISDQKLVTGQLESQKSLLKELTCTYPLICYETDYTGMILQIYGHGLDLLGLNAEDLEKNPLISVFKELKSELDIENLTDILKVEYKKKMTEKTFLVTHKIVKNTSSGGVIGCVEVLE